MNHRRPIDDMRAAALLGVLDVAEQHQLPLPAHIHLFEHSSLMLRFTDEDYAAVAGWAAALNLGPVRATAVPKEACDFVSVRAGRKFDGGWRGWKDVEVWAACWYGTPTRGGVEAGDLG